jgi:hypothetical protein
MREGKEKCDPAGKHSLLAAAAAQAEDDPGAGVTPSSALLSPLSQLTRAASTNKLQTAIRYDLCPVSPNKVHAITHFTCRSLTDRWQSLPRQPICCSQFVRWTVCYIKGRVLVVHDSESQVRTEQPQKAMRRIAKKWMADRIRSFDKMERHKSD